MIAQAVATLVAAFPIKPPTPPATVGEVDVVERLNEPVPTGLRFVDAFHNQVRLGDFLGHDKPVVLSLMYFDCPMLCSLVERGLVKGLSESGLALGKDYAAVTVSFNPKDTPRQAMEAQAGYVAHLANRQAATARDWAFLTGPETEIHRLAEALGFNYRWDKPTQQFEHPAVIFVLTPDGRIARYLYGVEFLARDLRLAVVEASQGRVGTTLDRVLLKCFRYDPTSKRYRVIAVNFVRAGAFCVLLALATGLTILWRQELKRKRSSAPLGRPAP
ncbi:MAG: SCO family protein [Myxococcales bacterium]